MTTTAAKIWKVTMRTGERTWWTIDIEAADFGAAVATAQRLIGGQFVSVA